MRYVGWAPGVFSFYKIGAGLNKPLLVVLTPNGTTDNYFLTILCAVTISVTIVGCFCMTSLSRRLVFAAIVLLDLSAWMIVLRLGSEIGEFVGKDRTWASWFYFWVKVSVRMLAFPEVPLIISARLAAWFRSSEIPIPPLYFSSYTAVLSWWGMLDRAAVVQLIVAPAPLVLSPVG